MKLGLVIKICDVKERTKDLRYSKGKKMEGKETGKNETFETKRRSVTLPNFSPVSKT